MTDNAREANRTALQLYMMRHDLDTTSMGALIGVSRQAVHFWQTGRHPIPGPVAFILENDFYPKGE